jgi:hypothetical protein
MNNSKSFTISAILLAILAIIMIYLGGFHFDKLLLPPIITGLGFFIIAKVLLDLKKK